MLRKLMKARLWRSLRFALREAASEWRTNATPLFRRSVASIMPAEGSS
jgi:hypothetical protein